MPGYKIILADDHEILRAGLKSLIEKNNLFKVVGQVKDGQELLDLLKLTKCDLVVLDLSMPNMDGLTTIKEVHRKFPKVRIVVLTMQKDSEHFRHAIASGASGYILKEDAYDQLTLAIKVILNGKQYFSPSVSALITDHYIRSSDEADQSSPKILTKRELQILKLVANGSSNKNIASKLSLSIRTVETHRAHLTTKLGIKTTAHLVKYAMAKGLI